MRVVRFLWLTAAASFLSAFACVGLVTVIDVWLPRPGPSPIAVSDSVIDFGSVPLNGSETRELLVRNDGAVTIRARFEVNGASYRVEPRELTMDPGVEWSITVVATPARAGRIDDLLRIRVVGADAMALVIPIAAVAGEVGREPGWRMNRV